MAGRKTKIINYQNLTGKQKAWFDYYQEGKSQTEAARLAGYKFPEISGYQNMDKLSGLLEESKKSDVEGRIASIDETREFFTAVMRDESVNIKDRFKAGEILLKLESGLKDKDSDDTKVDEIVVRLGEADKYGE